MIREFGKCQLMIDRALILAAKTSEVDAMLYGV